MLNEILTKKAIKTITRIRKIYRLKDFLTEAAIDDEILFI